MLDKHEIELAIGDWVTFYTERGMPENVNWRTGYVINIKDNQAFVCDGDPRVSDWKERIVID